MSEQTPGPPAAEEPPQPAAQPQSASPYGVPPQPPYGAQPPPYPPYGVQPQPYPPYGVQPPYGHPGYGHPQPPGYGTPPYGGYPQPTPTPGSTIALVVVSGICTLGCLFGIPSLVIGIVALTKVNTDIAQTRRLTRIGWIVLAIVGAVAVIAIVAIIVIVVTTADTTPDYTFDTVRAPGTTAAALALRST